MNDTESARTGAAVDQTELLETVEIETRTEPSAAVIWLHGLGADGHDFEPIVPAVLWPQAPAIRFVFPHAPVRPITVNGGMSMRAWYDIVSISSDRNQDQAGIATSVRQVEQLVAREQQRGIATNRIVIAGFSQGGAIALQMALRYPQRLAGLMALSCYLLNAGQLEAQVHPANRDLPVFMGHGSMDPVVPFSMGEGAAAELKRLGYPVEWHSYPIPHSVSPDEVRDIAGWLRQRLG